MDNLTQLFTQAATLMLTGMVFVFVFLGLLVIFINVVLKKLAIKYPDPIAPKRALAPTSKNIQSTNAVSPSIVAAISSAVSTYRQQHNNNH
tara:strand:+ start:768 stop:1040 length:273 start_codon:yes stop_codon:yes gene_type:complete